MTGYTRGNRAHSLGMRVRWVLALDEAGRLRIVGRVKDMFIVGGFNAYPAEIENALLRLPFRQLFIFRIAIVVPLHGIKSRTTAYRWGYTLLTPVMPL